MAIPSTVQPTAAGYVDYFKSQVNLADKLWTHYGWAASKAYAAAFEKVKSDLGKVKVAQLAHQQDDYNRMSFALSLLTVGVAGATAGGVARFMLTKEGSKNVEDAVKQVLQKVQQKMAEPGIDALSPDKKVPDVFAPADITPEEYTTGLQEGISYNVAALTLIQNELEWGAPANVSVNFDGKVIKLKSGVQLTLDETKKLIESLLDSSFMTNMAPLDVNIEKLTTKASLALWIGWALARDDRYWIDAPQTNTNRFYDKIRVRNDDLDDQKKAFWEQHDWEPVRSSLVRLGIPPHQITAKLVVPDGARWKEMPGLFMWGFMQWAGSPLSAALLFDNTLPINAKGFEKARDQMSRRMLGPMGWIDTP